MAVTAAAWLALGATQAVAAQRYASPGGSGTGCTAPETSPGPCDIQTAVSAAGVGDQVIVETGDYGSAGSPMSSAVNETAASVTIHAGSGSRPRLFFGNAGVGVFGMGSTISGLDIEAASSGPALSLGMGASADRMFVHNSVDVACDVLAPISNSVCWTDGPTGDGLAVDPSSGSLLRVALRNDTIEATGSGSGGDVGLFVTTSGTSQGVTVNTLNVIIHGAPTRDDVVAKPEMVNSPVTINLGYSNYVTSVVGGNGMSPGAINEIPAGSNQMTPPVFVNAAAGDFHEVTRSSGTVNRGHNDGSLGSLDLDGNPRIVGSAPDIGAYEHQAPTVTASVKPATVAGATPATFSASGTPSRAGDSLSYVWHFDDGASASGATVNHGFATAGSHVGTVTVSDASGDSARATATITVTPATVSALSVSPSKSPVIGRKVNGRCVKPTKKNKADKHCQLPIKLMISYTLDAPAAVTFKLIRHAPGRKVKGHCVKPTKQNRTDPKCTRRVTLSGAIVRSGHAGANRFTFNGKIGGHRLGPGAYQLIATPGGGQPKGATFKLTG